MGSAFPAIVAVTGSASGNDVDPGEGHSHVITVLTDLPEDETIEFAERLRIVHEETWNAELSAIDQATPETNSTPTD